MMWIDIAYVSTRKICPIWQLTIIHKSDNLIFCLFHLHKSIFVYRLNISILWWHSFRLYNCKLLWCYDWGVCIFVIYCCRCLWNLAFNLMFCIDSLFTLLYWFNYFVFCCYYFLPATIHVLIECILYVNISNMWLSGFFFVIVWMCGWVCTR